MSSTNRGAVRSQDDFYETPPALAELMTREVIHLYSDLYDGPPVNVLDAGCGSGNFMDAVRGCSPSSVAEGIEINPALAEIAKANGHTVRVGDYLKDDLPNWSLILGNPPYVMADQFFKRSWELAAPQYGMVAFLLRLNYLGGQKRFEEIWSKTKPAYVWVFPVRPGFTGDGRTDSIEYMACLWLKQFKDGITEFRFIDNRQIENRHWNHRPTAAKVGQMELFKP